MKNFQVPTFLLTVVFEVSTLNFIFSLILISSCGLMFLGTCVRAQNKHLQVNVVGSDGGCFST